MTLQDLLTLMLRKWLVILAGVIIGGVAGFLYESSQDDVVATSGRLLIGPALDSGFNVVDSTGSLSRGTVQQTLAEIATGSAVTDAAAAGIGLDAGSFGTTSVVIPETNVVQVRVTGSDPGAAIELATATMAEAEAAFERTYPVYDVAVIDEPGDASKIAPKPELGLVLGAVAGAGLATIGIALRDASDRKRRRTARPTASAPVPAAPGAAPTSDGPAWYDPPGQPGPGAPDVGRTDLESSRLE